MSNDLNRGAAVKASSVVLFPQPALQSIYDTAPIGLAFLSPDCRYLQINQRLTEICGISVEDHLGHSVRDCVPALAEAVMMNSYPGPYGQVLTNLFLNSRACVC